MIEQIQRCKKSYTVSSPRYKILIGACSINLLTKIAPFHLPQLHTIPVEYLTFNAIKTKPLVSYPYATTEIDHCYCYKLLLIYIV